MRCPHTFALLSEKYNGFWLCYNAIWSVLCYNISVAATTSRHARPLQRVLFVVALAIARAGAPALICSLNSRPDGIRLSDFLVGLEYRTFSRCLTLASVSRGAALLCCAVLYCGVLYCAVMRCTTVAYCRVVTLRDIFSSFFFSILFRWRKLLSWAGNMSLSGAG